jgi:hypothetical protein
MSPGRPILAALVLAVAFALPTGTPTRAAEAGHSPARQATPPMARRGSAGQVVKRASTGMKPLVIGVPLASTPRHRQPQVGVLGGPSSFDARRLVRR